VITIFKGREDVRDERRETYTHTHTHTHTHRERERERERERGWRECREWRECEERRERTEYAIAKYVKGKRENRK